MRVRSARRRFTVLAVALLATSVVSPGQAAASPPQQDSRIAGTNGAPVPALQWGPCPEGTPAEYECSVADVPLSYRDPHGQSIQLAVGRLPAADQANKLGTIFYNPGGPGGSGRIPPALTPTLHERFDIVGFDPRGVGASTGLRCFTDEANKRLLGGQFPITPEQERTLVEDTAKGTALCEQNAGPLINHMSTANVARDMDLLRKAVGEEQLSYYGVSYGTHLGEVYANLFPDRVGAVAIDAVLDPVEWTTGYQPGENFEPFTYRLGSHLGTQRALRSFLDACAADERCAFREPGVDLFAKYNAILDRLLGGPITVTDPETGQQTEVTYQQVVNVTKGMLYSASNATTLGELLQQLADAMAAPTPLDGRAPLVDVPEPRQGPGYQQAVYSGPEQGLAVMCADTANPANPYEWARYARKTDQEARGFGPSWTYLSLACATWPGVDPDRYTGPWDRETANPLLVIGNRKGDPATPYEDAQRVADLLGDARLLTLDAYGHGARGESACIDSALDAYFIDGTLPAEGTVCQPDRGPFDPPPAP